MVRTRVVTFMLITAAAVARLAAPATSLAANSPRISGIEFHLSAHVNNSTGIQGPCPTNAVRDLFPRNSPAVIVTAHISNWYGRHPLDVNWFSPQAKIYQHSSESYTVNGSTMFCDYLNIAGTAVAASPGSWIIQFKIDGKVAALSEFLLQSSSASGMPSASGSGSSSSLVGSPGSYRSDLWTVAQSTSDLIQEYLQDEQTDWPGDCGSCDPTIQSVSDMQGIQRAELQPGRQLQGIQSRFHVRSGDSGMYGQPVLKLEWALHHLDSAVVATANGGYGDGDAEATQAQRSLNGAWTAIKNIR